jgi:putative Holliday junction resolvase
LRILAVDWGERRIGLAVSDPSGTIATGLPTLQVRGRDDALARVAAVAAEVEAERLLVGLPLLLSGERGEAARAAEAFASALGSRTGLPVDTYDERLTSVMGQRRLKEIGRRGSRNKVRVDQGAAVALLESYLRRLAFQKGSGSAPDEGDDDADRPPEGRS